MSGLCSRVWAAWRHRGKYLVEETAKVHLTGRVEAPLNPPPNLPTEGFHFKDPTKQTNLAQQTETTSWCADLTRGTPVQWIAFRSFRPSARRQMEPGVKCQPDPQLASGHQGNYGITQSPDMRVDCQLPQVANRYQPHDVVRRDSSTSASSRPSSSSDTDSRSDPGDSYYDY